MLTSVQATALSREIDAASSLLRHGFGILAGYRFASRDAEPVFACLAGGSEKLLKLTVGVVALDGGEAWPSKATMKAAGHKIVELDTTVREAISTRREHSTAPGLIGELLERTDGHPGVVQILRTLERYAVNGRFYNLDLLGGREHPDVSPHELWGELEMDIVDANPEMLDLAADGEHETIRTDMNRILGLSLGLWCELIRRSWITGVCGALAAQWSPQLNTSAIQSRGSPSSRSLRRDCEPRIPRCQRASRAKSGTSGPVTAQQATTKTWCRRDQATRPRGRGPACDGDRAWASTPCRSQSSTGACGA
jgi:hypothetical protein